MDWLANQVDTLTKQASEITVYDIKSAYNKAKAYALNLTEYEAKVHEATNDEPWGASSTLMQDIAQATFNFQLFNEVMPCIYARFTDKEARQWRQIYKALVLLEYLVKNGSERVVDDARSNSSVIRVLRNFHYIDENGKDQGINVRNRAKEINELLGDLDRVRQERRKAKANRAKYTGVSSDGFRSGGGGGGYSGGFSGGGGAASGSRYGGFGSDSYYAGNGGGSGGASGGFSDSHASAGEFEEYDAGDDEDLDVRRSRTGGPSARMASSRSSAASAPPAAAPPPPAPKQPEVNLFDFDDDDDVAAATPAAVPAPASGLPTLPPKLNVSTTAAAPTSSLDDDFDDFQSATPVASPGASASRPISPQQPAAGGRAPGAGAAPNVFSLLTPSSTSASSPAAGGPSQYRSNSNFAQPLQAASRPTMSSQSSVSSARSAGPPGGTMSPQGQGQGQQGTNGKKPAAADFSDLFDMVGGGGASASKPATPAGGGQSLAAIAAQKRQDSLFASTSTKGGNASMGGGDGWDSLL
ncbi:hypothetical protein JCM8202_005848 [Rhodotorula sphaerocarpa]